MRRLVFALALGAGVGAVLWQLFRCCGLLEGL